MKEHYAAFKKYCKDVTTGKTIAGGYTKKAVKRFLNDVKRQSDADFLFEFRPELVFCITQKA